MFSIYFPYPSQKTLFAAHHLKGPAKDWWVFRRAEYYDKVWQRSRYPDWSGFVWIFKEQFLDPAIEEQHEKAMYNLHMGNGPATTFFTKLEQEAKLAGLRDKEEEKDHLT